jgi:hypothetical protein
MEDISLLILSEGYGMLLKLPHKIVRTTDMVIKLLIYLIDYTILNTVFGLLGGIIVVPLGLKAGIFRQE